MAKSFLNLRPGVDFPEDGTDVLPYLQALEKKCMELEDAIAAGKDSTVAIEADVTALKTLTGDATKGNAALDARVAALEG